MRCRTHTWRRTLPTLLALALVATGAAQAAEKMKGYAEYRKGEALIVDGQRVVVTKSTKINGTSRKARDFTSIPLGYEVNLKGTRRDDGSIRAREIEVSRNRDTAIDVELSKSFDAIEALFLEKGRMVMVDENGKVVEDLGKLLTSGPLVERTRRIATRLAPPSVRPEDFRVYVVENDEWNAVAAPNFSIYVFSGLLRDMDDDEVAIVVGHELAHATYEHSRRQYERNSLVQTGAAVAAALAARTIDDQRLNELTRFGAAATAMTLVNVYSREHEDQADRVGLRYAYEAGYDVAKGPALWKRFAGKYGETPQAVNFFLGSHSRASKRAKLLQQEIAYNYSGRETRTTARAR